jgi:hypothetical protein
MQGDYVRIEVSCSQNLPDVLHWMKSKFGGEIYKSAGHASQWKLHGQKSFPFLNVIRPYLIVKAIDVQEAFAIWEARDRPELAKSMITQRKLRRDYANRESVK